MHVRVLVSLLGISIIANVVAVYYLLNRPGMPPATATQTVVRTSPPPRIVKTNVLVSATPFDWSQVESEDYETYIANLRAIGCPEPTIRDIIVAEVNQLFARRRANEVLTPVHQWWRSQPDPAVQRAAEDQIEQLEAERRALLTHLLGDGWQTSGNALPMPDVSATPLTGPLLGDLPPETKAEVQQITRAGERRVREYLDSLGEGQPPDPVDLARIDLQTREELAAVLAPAQLQEFLLRYSVTAEDLRGQLQGITVTPEQFRELFRAQDQASRAYLAQVGTAASNPSATQTQAGEIQSNLEEAFRETLGAENYEYFQLYQDPSFREARATIEQLGGDPEAVLPLYQINQLAETEARRIQNDPALTDEERTDALLEVQREQLQSIQTLLSALQTNRGPTPPARNVSPRPIPPVPPLPDYTP